MASAAALVQLAQHASAAVFLAVAAAYDVRGRSVPSVLLFAFLGVEAVLLALRLYLGGLPPLWGLYAAVDLLILGVVAGLALLCLMGPGDLVAFAGIVASEPWGWRLLPLPLTTLLYYSIASLALLAYNAVANLADPEARRRLARMPLGKRLARLLTSRLVPVEKILKGAWWIPVELEREESRRVVCSVEVDPRSIVERALREGRVSRSDRVWATYGIPALLPLLAAYIAALLAGDKPITLLLSLLTRGRP